MTKFFYIGANLSEALTRFWNSNKILSICLDNVSEIMTRDQNASISIKKALLKYLGMRWKASFLDKSSGYKSENKLQLQYRSLLS